MANKNNKTGKGSGSTTYSPEKLNTVLKDRKSTMPPLSGPPDPQRPPAGPPADAFEQMVMDLLTFNRARLHLVGFVTQQQAAEDQAQWFKEAHEYIERTAIMQEAGGDNYVHIPFTGADLKSRGRRIKAVARWMDESLAFLRLVGHTLRTEQADLVRMADVVVTETELVILRPTLDDQKRTDLMTLSEFPMSIWRKRQAGIQLTKDERQQARDALDLLDQMEQQLAAGQTGPGQVTVSVPHTPVPPVPTPVDHPVTTPGGKGKGSQTKAQGQLQPRRNPRGRGGGGQGGGGRGGGGQGGGTGGTVH